MDGLVQDTSSSVATVLGVTLRPSTSSGSEIQNIKYLQICLLRTVLNCKEIFLSLVIQTQKAILIWYSYLNLLHLYALSGDIIKYL